MFDIALFKELENKGLENFKILNLKEHEQIGSKKKELLELMKELPKLQVKNESEVIYNLIINFLERYPKCIEGYECFIKFYLKIEDYKTALNLIYSALFVDKKNSIILNLLKYCEVNLIKNVTKIPLKYKTWILYPETRLYKDKFKSYNHLICSSLHNEKIQIIKHGKFHIALAKKKLFPGEIIFQTKPLIVTQHIFSEHYVYSTCYHCLKERSKSNQFYSCPVNPYTCPYIFCSFDCLINNIRIHSIECSILSTITAAAKEANLTYYSVLHIFRLLIKVGLEQEYKDKEYDILNEIFNVESYYESVKECQKDLFESFNTLANRIILEFDPPFYLHLKQKELVQFMLIVWQYSPFIKYYSPSSIIQYQNPETAFGLIYCPILAKLHHSCIPTCTYYYDDNGQLTLRSLYNIPEGGKLCISILTDQYLPLKIRKNFKGMPRIFGCGCIRCCDPTENNLHLRSMKCPKCILGYIYPIKTEALIEALKLYRIDKQKKKINENMKFKKINQTKDILKMNTLNENTNISDTDLNKTVNLNEEDTNKNEEDINKSEKSPNKNEILTFNEKEKNILKKLENENERWLCSNCGKLSLSRNKRCMKLENKAYLLYNEAEKNYMNGNIVLARKQLLKLYNDFFNVLHPNHYIIFNTNVLLAGLLRCEPNKQVFDSLYFLRKAIISADEALPIAALEKVHLYLHLSEYTLASSNLHKLYNKGLGIPSSFIIDPIYAAVWNSFVTTGSDSILTTVLIQKLRMLSIALNIFTPHNELEIKIEKEEEFSDFYYKVTKKKVDSIQMIKNIMENDYFYPIYIASQCFDLDFENNKHYLNIFKTYRNIQYFGNGLTALGLAASCGNVNLVKVLLSLKYSLFQTNELNINPLLAMCCSYLPDENLTYHSNYYYTILKEIEIQNIDFDEFEKIYNTLKNSLNNTNSDLYTIKTKSFSSYNPKNAIEQVIPLDISLDEEFVYGDKSKEMDKNQAKILIIFLKHLDKIHIKKKKKFKKELNVKKTNSLNNKILNNFNDYKTGDDTSSNSDTNSSGSDTKDIFYNIDLKNVNNVTNECYSDTSEDVLNNKMKNYYTEKLLTKTFSHKILGHNNCLHYACARGKIELVKQLIISGIPINLLNDEGSTALHIASFNGHNEIVKILIKYKSNINALTCHGESPLMLATYSLHYDVIQTLTENKASIITKNNNKINILHCLVYGLLRTHTIYYKNRSCKDDITTMTIQGFGELNSSKYYTQGLTHLNINFTTSEIPIIEQISHDFFIFPFKLLHRLKKAILILKYLLNYCPLYLYELKNSNGYNPSELLKLIWKKICEKRIEVLNKMDLRIVAFTEKQKNLIFQTWSLIISLVNMFFSILQPDKNILSSIYKNFIIPKELENKNDQINKDTKSTENKIDNKIENKIDNAKSITKKVNFADVKNENNELTKNKTAVNSEKSTNLKNMPNLNKSVTKSKFPKKLSNFLGVKMKAPTSK